MTEERIRGNTKKGNSAPVVREELWNLEKKTENRKGPRGGGLTSAEQFSGTGAVHVNLVI